MLLLSCTIILSTQEVNNELDRTTQEVILSLPSVIRSVDVIAQEASTLRDRMATVKHEIETIEKVLGFSQDKIDDDNTTTRARPSRCVC